jgi:lipopolysaccharide/colanic/teichoic acid biosynthesis glycosyltransferase
MLADDQTTCSRPKSGAGETRTDHAPLAQTFLDHPVWREDTPGVGEPLPPPLPARAWYLPVKAVLEFVLAFVLLVLSIPLIALMTVLVKLTSRGPAFYSQLRLGKGGKAFKLHKIRTMIHDCEKASGPRWSVPGDPRITPVGCFLRQTHLDELPQLWNVLRGEMSLVGPRPERPELVPGLEERIPHYRDRLLVRPGVTGLAQVQLPADTDLNSVRRKLAYDLYYVRHLGPWLDLRLIACTAARMVGVPFHVVCPLFRMPPRDTVEYHYRARQSAATGMPHLSPPRTAPDAV